MFEFSPILEKLGFPGQALADLFLQDATAPFLALPAQSLRGVKGSGSQAVHKNSKFWVYFD